MPTTDEWLRRRPTRSERRNDAIVGVALAGLSMFAIELQHSSYPRVGLGWEGIEGYLWAAALGLVLCVRRTYPLSVLVVASLLFFGLGYRLQMLGGSVFVQIGLFLAMYTAWAWSRKRVLLRWTFGVVVLGMFVWVAWQLSTSESLANLPQLGMFDPVFAAAAYSVGINVIYFFGAMAWGTVSWRGARQRDELEQQAEALRREQAENARRAVAEERVRIARDLHDVVAHHVSSIGVQAAGARRLMEREPESTSAALRTIETSSRTAVSEMHQLVGLLRSYEHENNGDADRSPQPGLEALRDLVAATRSERLGVELREVGEPFDVSDTIGLSLYRTAQEALSNVREHSSATSVSVVLRYVTLDDDGRAAEIEVIDNGSPAPRGRRDEKRTGGWGLKGIEERAVLHGGETEIGPRPDGGFRVRMRIPVED